MSVADSKFSQTFTVTNNGDSEKEYTLSHIPAGTALTVASVSCTGCIHFSQWLNIWIGHDLPC